MERCTPLAIVNAQLVNEGECYGGAVLVDSEGRIAQVIRGGAPVPTSGYRVMDAGGAYLFPGVIDTHVHFREPGLTQKGDIHTESAAAVAGGVTSFLDMPNTKPPTTDIAALQEKKRLAQGRAYANYGFYLGASTGNLEAIQRVDSREVPAIKLFMGSSTGSLQVTDSAALEQIFAQSPLPIAVHCETDAIIAKNLAEAKAKWGDEIPFTEHAAIRCSAGCLQSTRLAIGLALSHKAHLHILHISTKEEVEELQRLATTGAAGLVTAETCLHYLWFCNDDLSRLTWQLKCNPAIKYKEDRQALRTALRQGVFSTIGTDHAPHLEMEKKQNYALSPSGIPSIQYAFVGLLEVAEQENIPLPRVVELTAHTPARLFRIEERGYLREGYIADLVLVAREAKAYSVGSLPIYGRCGWSPYQGESFHYCVKTTIVGGIPVYQQGALSENPCGQPLTFHSLY